MFQLLCERVWAKVSHMSIGKSELKQFEGMISPRHSILEFAGSFQRITTIRGSKFKKHLSRMRIMTWTFWYTKPALNPISPYQISLLVYIASTLKRPIDCEFCFIAKEWDFRQPAKNNFGFIIEKRRCAYVHPQLV